MDAEKEILRKIDKEVLIEFILNEIVPRGYAMDKLQFMDKWDRVEKLQKKEDEIAKLQDSCDLLSENPDPERWLKLENKRVKIQNERWALTA